MKLYALQALDRDLEPYPVPVWWTGEIDHGLFRWTNDKFAARTWLDIFDPHQVISEALDKVRSSHGPTFVDEARLRVTVITRDGLP